MDTIAVRPGIGNLNRLPYFAAVVDAGSFTRAAERLGVTKAVVSQQVARLEEEVGTSLLVRTTRRVHATQAGLVLHARCRVILSECADAFDELAEGAVVPQGTLRLTAPIDYGTSVVVPIVAEFVRLYPRCDVVMMLSDSTLDASTFDLAIRVGWLKDSSHQARRIAVFHQRLVCAPRFGRLLPQLHSPGDLAGLPFVANASLPEPGVCRFNFAGRRQSTVRMRSIIAINATPAVRAAVIAGAGLSVLPDYLVDADIAAGRLQHVLPEWSLRSGGVHAVFPATRYRAAKVSRFVELMLDAKNGAR